jgi:release factor glutamine methyltransferase
MTWSTDFLKDRGMVDSPRLDAELLLAHALGCTRMQLYTAFDKPLSPKEREPFRDFLKRRAAGEPVAYIVGTKEFMSRSFAVTRDVLIPRPDTEVLVEAVLSFAKRPDIGTLHILDVGTGSGCIAISLGLRLNEVKLTAWDVDPAALALAEANARRLGAGNVTFEEKDALDAANWRASEGAFDVIVSNPPYIALDEAPALAKSVKDFEPHLALFAADAGLSFYLVFAEHAAERLRPEGRIYCEIGYAQAAAVKELFAAAGWRDVTVLKDYGKNDRVVVATRPASGARP